MSLGEHHCPRQKQKQHPILAINELMDMSGLGDRPVSAPKLDALKQFLQRVDEEWAQKYGAIAGTEADMGRLLKDLNQRVDQTIDDAPKSALDDPRVLQAAYVLLRDVMVTRRQIYKARLARLDRPLCDLSKDETRCVSACGQLLCTSAMGDTEKLFVCKRMDDAARLAFSYSLEYTKYFSRPGTTEAKRMAQDVLSSCFGVRIAKTMVKKQLRRGTSRARGFPRTRGAESPTSSRTPRK